MSTHFMHNSDPEYEGAVALCDYKNGLEHPLRDATISSIIRSEVTCPDCLKYLASHDSNEDTKWDLWLDKHPKTDMFINRLHRLRRLPKNRLQDYKAWRTWKPGMYYLDHGSHPCVLIELEQFDALVGVSLVDGSIKGGCSIYACGPEPTDAKTARDMADHLRQCAAGNHEIETFLVEKFGDIGICKHCDEPKGGWGDLAQQEGIWPHWQAALQERTKKKAND